MSEFLNSSWPIIIPIFVVGFICGACWMRARQRDTYNRRALQISGAVDRALSTQKGVTT